MIIAEKRLKVLGDLDSLGAGFPLASHDLDIRGAGNLLGDEQSGHVREVGIELYQQLLEEAVCEARRDKKTKQEEWSPQINVGTSVLIPENYVTDLSVRLGLYRRIAVLLDARRMEREQFIAAARAALAQALQAAGLRCEHLELEGDGRHWYATIVSPEFEGQRCLVWMQRKGNT